MPTYEYTAIDIATDKPRQAIIEAPDHITARASLRERGLRVQTLDIVDPRKQPQGLMGKLRNTRIGPGKIPYKELAWMSHRLASSQRKGIDLVQTMNLLVTQKPKSALAPAMKDVIEQMNQGISLTEAFESHRDVFGQETIALLNAGYASGTLGDTLDQLAQIMRDRVENKASIRTALMGPAITLVFTFIMAFALLLFAIPKFDTILGEFGTKLPTLTQWCLDLSNSIKHMWFIWVFGTIAAVIVWGYFWNHPKYGIDMSRAMLNMGKIGYIMNETVLARIATTLGTLLIAGLGVEEALAHAADVSKNKYHRYLLKEIRETVRSGHTISFAFQNASSLYSELTLAIQAGEEGGDLGESISKYAREATHEVNELNKTLKDAINPIMYVIVAVVVGFLAVALYLPILSSYGAVAKGQYTPAKK